MITIVIPIFNEEYEIIDTLDRLNQHLINNKIEEYQVIVIDSSSTFSSDILRQSEYVNNEKYLIVHSDIQLYPGKARNMGVRAAKYELIIFTDSGFHFSDTWIQDLIGPFKSNPSLSISWGKVQTMINNKYDRYFAYLIEAHSKIRRVLPNCAIKRNVFLDGHWFEESIRAVEDTIFIREIQGKYDEVFTEAVNYYSGYPQSIVGSFKKWNTYTYYSVISGFSSKIKLSIVQFTVYLLLFIVLPFKYALGTFVVLHFLRFYLQANKSYSIKITEYFEIFFLTLALDTGRLIGSIRGLIYRHKVKDVQD